MGDEGSVRLSLRRDLTWTPGQLRRGARKLPDAATIKPRPSTSQVSATHKHKLLTMWTHQEPDKLYLVPMEKANPHSQVHHFLQEHFHHDQKSYSLAMLVAGAEYPIPVMRHNLNLDQGILLCLPLLSVAVHVQSPGGGVFQETINPLNTIADLKDLIRTSKGYPPSCQELLLNGHVLCNHHLILDYKISGGAKVQLVLQPSRPFPVEVKTFWGCSYTMEVMACMSSGQLLHNILQRALGPSSSSGGGEELLQHKSMYNHLLLLEHQKVMLDKSTCLNYYSVQPDSVIQVLSTSEVRKDNIKSLRVTTIDGKAWPLNAAVYDTWFIVALKLHGLSSVPVSKMILSLHDRTVDLQCTIGALKHNHTMQVKLAVAPERTSPITHPNQDTLSLHVRLPSGITETVQCSPKDLVKEVKKKLQHLGYPDAVYHDLVHKRVRMSSHNKLSDYKLSASPVLDLRLSDFPVFVTQGATSLAITANMHWCVQDLIHRIQEKLNLPSNKHCVLFKGENIHVSGVELVSLEKAGLTIQSKVYVESVPEGQTLHLVTGSDVIPVKANLDSVNHQQVEQLCSSPAAFMSSLKWFLQWRYPYKTTSDPAEALTPRRAPTAQRFATRGIISHKFASDDNNKSDDKSSELTSPRPSNIITSCMIAPRRKAFKSITDLAFDSNVFGRTRMGSLLQGRAKCQPPKLPDNGEPLRPNLKPASAGASTSSNILNISSKKKPLSVRFELPSDGITENHTKYSKDTSTTDYYISEGKASMKSPRALQHRHSATGTERFKPKSLTSPWIFHRTPSEASLQVGSQGKKKEPSTAYSKNQLSNASHIRNGVANKDQQAEPKQCNSHQQPKSSYHSQTKEKAVLNKTKSEVQSDSQEVYTYSLSSH